MKRTVRQSLKSLTVQSIPLRSLKKPPPKSINNSGKTTCRKVLTTQKKPAEATKGESKKVTKIITILAVGFCLINYILYGNVWKNQDLMLATFGLIFLFSLLSLITSNRMLSVRGKEQKVVMKTYMLITLVRVLSLGSALVLLIFKFEKLAMALVFNFFVLYFTYTIIEKFYIMGSVRKSAQ